MVVAHSTINKMTVRKMISYTLEQHNLTGDKDKLIRLAMLKGLYISLGGEKGIPTSAKFMPIVKYSKIVLGYVYRLKQTKNRFTADKYLIHSLRDMGKDNYIRSISNLADREGLALLLTKLIMDEYTEDIMINTQAIFRNAYELLDELGGGHCYV